MSRTKDSIAGLLIGFGLVLGFIPIAIASLLINKNLFIEIISRMDLFWKEREQSIAEKEVWVSEKDINDHIKSFGQPGYDKESQSVKGKSEFPGSVQ